MKLNEIPSVDQVLRGLKPIDGLPPEVITNQIRVVLGELREALKRGQPPEEAIGQAVLARLNALARPTLRPVINASGVILHTNLGRAPLAAFEPLMGYSNLEYDLLNGKRGKRDSHIAPLLEQILGVPGIVVNNNAAAVYLVLNEVAAGEEVIVSRGELIEIGDGFRIPEIMVRSGAVLREVGTTNRTRLEDYEEAINERTRLILRVHPSNFRVSGFTSRPELRELATLALEHKIPLYEDLGSGCLVDLAKYGIREPLVAGSLKSGVNLVSFSCDKLLGGPQSGIIAGDKQLVSRIRRNPMYRAFRVDKLTIQALQVTLHHVLRQEWRAIPTLRMIFQTADEIRLRAERVADALAPLACQIRTGESAIGGGSTAEQPVPTWVIAVSVPDPVSFERKLREAAIPVIARIKDDEVLLDLRTVHDEEEPLLIAAVRAANEGAPSQP
ncbi:MAG: L-seryl-tRNA(Sec) selenium transferase [Acidobacteriaceae bacterium]|nr:L-seryl-tRNA(Sec) selenium transferase [Acidobacteriaceae bacterium]MBV9502640.1 L-seryl-tRNA(Sec) selenium transferase [Acidobacteriaceae bacterium]